MSDRKSLRFWFKATRPEFFVAPLGALIIGVAVAWGRYGVFHVIHFLLTILGVMLLNFGINLANDYYDYSGGSGTDALNKQPTPFSGGSRLLPKGLIEPQQILLFSVLCFLGSLLVGLYFFFLYGIIPFILGSIAAFSGFFYSANPLRFSHRGIGELLVGLNVGVLTCFGAYYVQVQLINLEPILASLPAAFSVTAVVWINEFSDFEADNQANKFTLVIRLGREHAIRIYQILMLLPYVIMLLGVLTRVFPISVLLGLLTLPKAFQTMRLASKAYTKVYELIPANAGTILVHITTCILFSVGYVMLGIL